MGETTTTLQGPDLEAGVPAESIREGRPLLGHAFGEAVLIARHGEELFAVGATCSHYGGPLAEGLQVGSELRCPWHHAAFELRTGEVRRAPAINALTCFNLEREGETVRVTGRRAPHVAVTKSGGPSSVVIIGAGAAGHAAAETLRNEGYGGPITLLGADESGPYDRPNISKDYLAGSAPEEWIPLRGPESYRERKIELRTGVKVTRIDVERRAVMLEDGTRLPWGALVLATGAEPVRLDIPGADLPHVHYLRTLTHSRAIIARAKEARRAVVLGASFIGLEVAASLRARGLEVHVAAPESTPLQKVLGAEVGAFMRSLHEENGVVFHLGQVARQIEANAVALGNGERLEADLVVVGVGVRPALGLAEEAGLLLDRGVKVNALLQTSAPGVWAAGDIARWPDPHTGEDIRVEHWVVAQRQGQTVARNILGKSEPFEAVPFFWTTQYDVPLRYVGHASQWDTVEVEGSLAARDCTVRYLRDGRVLAVATIGRAAASLEAERLLERSVEASGAQPSARDWSSSQRA